MKKYDIWNNKIKADQIRDIFLNPGFFVPISISFYDFIFLRLTKEIVQCKNIHIQKL